MTHEAAPLPAAPNTFTAPTPPPVLEERKYTPTPGDTVTKGTVNALYTSPEVVNINSEARRNGYAAQPPSIYALDLDDGSVLYVLPERGVDEGGVLIHDPDPRDPSPGKRLTPISLGGESPESVTIGETLSFPTVAATDVPSMRRVMRLVMLKNEGFSPSSAPGVSGRLETGKPNPLVAIEKRVTEYEDRKSRAIIEAENSRAEEELSDSPFSGAMEWPRQLQESSLIPVFNRRVTEELPLEDGTLLGPMLQAGYLVAFTLTTPNGLYIVRVGRTPQQSGPEGSQAELVGIGEPGEYLWTMRRIDATGTPIPGTGVKCRYLDAQHFDNVGIAPELPLHRMIRRSVREAARDASSSSSTLSWKEVMVKNPADSDPEQAFVPRGSRVEQVTVFR